MDFPNITLDAATAKRLAALGDKQQALQANIAFAQQNWERRGAELVEEGRTIWQDIAKLHALDLERINYTVSQDGKELVPVAVRLK